MLEAPRLLLVRAPLLLILVEAPPNALLFLALGVFGTLRFPTRSPPMTPWFELRFRAPAPPPRFDAPLLPAPRNIVPACAPPPR